MTLTALYINRPTVFRKQEIVPTQQWTKEEGSHSTFHTMQLNIKILFLS